MVLYGFTATLFAYCISLLSASALAAFSIVAGYQIVMFMLADDVYLAHTRQADHFVQAVPLRLLADIDLRQNLYHCMEDDHNSSVLCSVYCSSG